MNLVHRQQQRVPPLALLDGRLCVGNGPLVNGVGESFLDPLLGKSEESKAVSRNGK